VVLEPTGSPRRDSESRQSLEPIEACSAYLRDRNAVDPAVEMLFAELLDEATT
jgi:hypothetical protein